MMLIKQLKLMVPNFVKKFILRCRYHMRARKFTGSQYFCTVCEHQLGSFISLTEICNGKFIKDVDVNGTLHTVDGYETANVDSFLCPVCGSQDKARLFALFLNQKLGEIGQRERITLVHFAPEGGLSQFLKWDQRLNYRSADLFRDDVDDQVDLTNMKIYKDKSIDAFICSHILEHILDDKAAVSELYRALKVGGWGIVMVPILMTIDQTYEDITKVSDAERLKHFGQEDHVRIYAKSDFLNLLMGAGFFVKQLGQDHFGKDVFEKNGLSKTNIIYVVEKR